MVRITGYTFRADTYCPTCMANSMVKFVGEEQQGPDHWQVEDLLDSIAASLGIDREDERTFDSGDFPKVVFSTDDDGIECGQCGEAFG